MHEAKDGLFRRVVTHGDISHDVCRLGERGAPVVLLQELTGVTPRVVDLATQIHDAGYTVHLPVLYGAYGEQSSQLMGMLRARFCLWSELHLFTTGRTSPLVMWLRHLVNDVRSAAQPQVAVIGMCMTGSLVFGTLDHGSVAAGVAAQPSLPFALPPVRGRLARSVGLAAPDMEAAATSTTPLMVTRYADDWMTPDPRIEMIRERFGDDDCDETTSRDGVRRTACGRAVLVDVPGRKHATLTEHRHPHAVAAVLSFLAEHHPATS